MRFTTLFMILCALPAAGQYTAQRDGDVVRLEDTRNQTVVSIIPRAGNIAFEMKIKGHNVLRFPYASVQEFKGGLTGIPFMGPWANRLDEQAFYANGKKYAFDMELGNVRGVRPIHGFVTSTDQWKVIEAKSDNRSAWVTSRLEFFRQPAWMKQFPFAHAVEITYRLENGVLEVATNIENMSADPMPVSIGYHPYFQLTDSPRDEWTIGVGARSEWLLTPDKVPTGQTRPIEQFFPNPQNVALKDFDLDHVFGDLVRDSSGRSTVWVKGKSQKLEVVLGPNYRAAVIYAPSPSAAPAGRGGQGAGQAPAGRGGQGAQNRNFICFEPMAGITNALNLAHKGVYKELQSIAPGQTWKESFWLRTSGF